VKSDEFEYSSVSALDLLITKQASCVYSTTKSDSEQSQEEKPSRNRPAAEATEIIERGCGLNEPRLFYIYEKKGFISSRTVLTPSKDKASV